MQSAYSVLALTHAVHQTSDGKNSFMEAGALCESVSANLTELADIAVVGGAGAPGTDGDHGPEKFPATPKQPLHNVFCSETTSSKLGYAHT